MRAKLFALFWLLWVALPMAYAQTGENTGYFIKGQVVDSLSQLSVPYATLRIALASSPGKPVKLLACDEDGKFQTSMKAAGKYILSIQSIGQRPAEKRFTLTEKNPRLDLGKLYMQEDNQRLGEVTVTAQKPLIKAEIDKITYSLEDDPEAQTSNTLDMLRKVPMVTVDGDDQIQLKGSTNFKIYMNGKPSNLLSNNPSEVLKSMPANSVKDIEVITDPGAKYDAEGVGGIINIITTRNVLQGYTGSVRASVASTGSARGSGYVSLKAGKFGLDAMYNYSHERSPWLESSSTREDLTNDAQRFLTQNGRQKSSGPFQFGHLEGSYEIDSLNLLSLGVNLFQGKMKNISEYDVMMRDINQDPSYSYRRDAETQSTFGSTDVNFDYQHSTHKKDELLTISYRFSHSPNDSKSYTDLSDAWNYYLANTYPQNNVNDASTNEHTGQIDYTTPTWKDQTLEVGAKYIFRQSRSDVDRTSYNDSLSIWENMNTPDSHFKHTQHIYSGYLGYAMKFDKFGVKAGVRAEGTSLDVRYELAPERNFDTHYFDVVPTMTLSYQLNMAQQIRLGYNMRIRRPGIYFLNPYVNNTDPQNISYGNPNLDSEKSNNLNLNYSMFAQKISVNASLNYTFVNNSIQSYTFVDPESPGVFQTTYGNIGKEQTVGLFLYGNWNPAPLLRVYLNGGLNYMDLRSEGQDMANDGFNGHVFMGTQFNFPMDFRLDVNGMYASSRVQLQGRGPSFYSVGFALNKDFLKKKLSVRLSIRDPFWKRLKMESTTSDDLFSSRNISYRKGQVFEVSVSYRFGTLKEAIKKVRRGINNDDMKGGDTGGASSQGM